MTESRLRVLQLTSGDLWAGAEVQFFALCTTLHSNPAIELQVVVLNDGELAARLHAAGVNTRVLDERKHSAVVIFRQLLVLLRQWRPHVVHTHRFKENVIGGVAAVCCGIASLRTVHGAQEATGAGFDLRRLLIRWLDIGTGRYLQQRVVAVTEDLRQKLLADYPARHVTTIPNGIVFAELDAASAVNITQATAQGGWVVGIVGRLTEVKRVDLFLQMAKLLLAAAPGRELHFLVIGGGPLLPALQVQAQQLGIADAVSFTGHVSPAADWIKALDVLVMCSDHEGMPMTLLEAMRLRTPIVAHRVGGLVELLEPSVDGETRDCAELVADHAATGYAQAVRKLLQNPALAAVKADNAWHQVTTNYSAQANAERFVALYRTLVRR